MGYAMRTGIGITQYVVQVICMEGGMAYSDDEQPMRKHWYILSAVRSTVFSGQDKPNDKLQCNKYNYSFRFC